MVFKNDWVFHKMTMTRPFFAESRHLKAKSRHVTSFWNSPTSRHVTSLTKIHESRHVTSFRNWHESRHVTSFWSHDSSHVTSYSWLVAPLMRGHPRRLKDFFKFGVWKDVFSSHSDSCPVGILAKWWMGSRGGSPSGSSAIVFLQILSLRRCLL